MAEPSRTFPFKRNLTVSPVLVPATNQASFVTLGRLPDSVTSFAMVNSYPVWIRLVGTPMESQQNQMASGNTGWLVPPGHFGVYSTQFPRGLSALAVDRPGFPLLNSNGNLMYPQATLELFYGSGA